MRDLKSIACSTAAAATLAIAAHAASPPEPQAGPLLPAWNGFVDGLRELAPRMLEKLPERLRDDPQVQQEIGRLMLEALAARSIEAIAADGDHPMFLPSLNLTLNVYQPNADTIYRSAQITPGGSYRLRGRAGSLRIARIGTFAPPAPDGSVRATAYYDLNSLKKDKDGNFDVLLSPSRPKDHAGDWWQLDPAATQLLLRQVAYDWSKERDPTISIERVDAPPSRPRPSAAELEQRLRQLAGNTSHTALFLVDHAEQLRTSGHINKFKVWDVISSFGGLFGQFYYETAYELNEDEALIIESEYPKSCAYASLILTNDIFETTDWYNNHSSLNGAQWRVDAGGDGRAPGNRCPAAAPGSRSGQAADAPARGNDLGAQAQAGVRYRDRGLCPLRREACDHRQHRGAGGDRQYPCAPGDSRS
ncbi:MAG: hypothetical protein IPI06_02885 [Gammaproteobacteria bacterium]|nr:hypothetical protein [Gammaproteobacteria bacterium]